MEKSREGWWRKVERVGGIEGSVGEEESSKEEGGRRRGKERGIGVEGSWERKKGLGEEEGGFGERKER